MRNFLLIIPLLIMGCAKDQSSTVIFSTTTSSITDSSVDINVDANVEGFKSSSQTGVVYSVSRDFDYNPRVYKYSYYGETDVQHEVIVELSQENSTSFNVNLSELNMNCWYYFKPFAVVNGAVNYGQIDSFKTLAPTEVSLGPAGGFVIYDDGNGGGIEMAPFDLAEIESDYTNLRPTFKWGCSSLSINGTQEILGSGEQNTTNIMQACSEIGAARMCSEFSYGGFNDWYLPSRNELDSIRIKLYSLGLGNLNNEQYWSSSQDESSFGTEAYVVSMQYPTSYISEDKDYYKRVRPVRTF